MTTPRIPRAVWLLGFVSLCMDFSSEMIHALLPVFLVSVLGASPVTLGLIEGVAEATASITKIFSGVLSDWFGRRKPLVVLGYGLAALSKPLFPLATSASWVLVARFADRIGKGIRGAPRDALVADLAPPEVRGAAFGLRQALDTAGALFGPLAAIGLMIVLANNIRTVFWIASVPALLAVLLLVWGIQEPARSLNESAPRRLPQWSDLRSFDRPFWIVLIIGAIFTLARLSEAFLVLRAHNAGLSLAWTPLALVVMNFTYVVSAYPAGWLSDRTGRVWLLAAGLALLIAANITLAFGEQLSMILIGIALWGFHLGLTQGQLATMVADTAPPTMRGSAFGIFYFASGIAVLLGSLLAGVLWKSFGPSFTFGAGAVFSAFALAGLIGWNSLYAKRAKK